MSEQNLKEAKYLEIFKKFKKRFLIDKGSIFRNIDQNEIFTKDNIDYLINNYIEKGYTGDASFIEKIKKQFDEQEAKERDAALEILAHAVWLWRLPPSNRTAEGTIKAVKEILELRNEKDEISLEGNEYFKEFTGMAAPGTYYNTNKFHELAYIIKFFQEIENESNKESNEKQKSEDNFNGIAINILKELKGKILINTKFKFDNGKKPAEVKNAEDKEKTASIHNALLHLFAREDYEPILSNNHKKQIVDTFSFLLDDNNNKENDEEKKDNELDIDEKISSIKKELKNIEGFYDSNIKQFWNFDGIDSDFDYSELDALKYKKQIIFYGPPGTSKTYSANKLAEILIKQKLIQNRDISNLLKNEENFANIINERISNLQLHPSYSYEDFIAGLQITENGTKWKKGWLLNKINEINKNNEIKENKIPYVIILDEINRVDLSRLFGELFSAIENRKEEIELQAMDKNNNPLKIKIPNNLYFIGTMNQIDFSLERIDFALRRRFVWYFYGYNKEKLNNIIKSNLDNKEKKIKDNQIDEFIKRSSKINKLIENDEEFGKNWAIGHTFFAEIVDIFYNVTETKLFKEPNNKDRLTEAKEAVKILWNISIKPMLEAFCGNLESSIKKEKIKKFENYFLKGNQNG